MAMHPRQTDAVATSPTARRLIIDLALARSGPGAGSSQAFMRQRTAMQPFPDLRDALRDIDWVVVGVAADRAYAPESSTKDFETLIRAADSERAAALLGAAGYEVVAELGIPGTAYARPGGLEVDVLYGQQPWLDEALAAIARDAAGFPILDLPYLVLMKLDAGRVQDISDLATMLGWADDATLARVRAVVGRFAPADRQDLESLIYLGRRERGLTD